jgi:ABC-2 type transport system ATP-binding protein
MAIQERINRCLMAVIEFDQVFKVFGTKEAVQDVTFRLEAGQAVALLGPNGAGKTTSIQMMLGLLKPTRGRVELFSHDPADPASHDRIGVVLQNVSVPERLKVKECLNLFRGFYARPKSLDELLDLGGLAEDADAMAHALSGGKTRRLQFALAMAGNPDVLFMDEPTVGMDVTSKRHFWDALRGFVSAGKTLVLTTHDLQEADLMTDRILVMNHGRIIADAPPEEIKMQFGGRQVKFSSGETGLAENMKGWPGVLDIQVAGRQLAVLTQDSDALLKRLFLDGHDIRDVEVGGGGLEEAFVRLTREDTPV